MKKPFVFDGHELLLGASIGISLFPDTAKEAQSMINQSDMAVYQAKRSGGNNFQFYRSNMRVASVEQLALETSLRKAGLWEEVKDRLHAPGTGLSGGQQQRLCIARTIAVSPEVVLMDEPCSALDPIATAKIEELISELSESYTIAIVTHSMQQAARVSHRTAYFHLGRPVEMNDTETGVPLAPKHNLSRRRGAQ